MTRERIKHVLMRPAAGGSAVAEGWLRTARHQKWGSFLEVNDGSCLKNLQCVVDASLPGYADLVKRLDTGAAVRVEGTLIDSPAKGQKYELKASAVHVYGAAPDFPLQKKGHTLEYLREIAHLRPRSNTFGAVLRLRHEFARAIHEFFHARGFVWVHTPIITASDCEGAGEMFKVTTLDLEKVPKKDGAIDWSQDFFGKPAHLTVSGQLNGETAALALTDVYTFGPTFRAENSNTARHLAEFWMVEPECAFMDLAGDMQLAEDFLKHLFRHALDHCADDLAFFAERFDKSLIATLTHVAESAFARMTYTEAVEALRKSGKTFEYPVEWGQDLQSEHERWLAEEHCKRPLILTDYPRDLKAFYMRQNDDGKTVAAMDVLAPKLGEIIGGSQREERLDLLDARMRKMNLEPTHYNWYRDLRRYGTVPHAGFGLGFERTIAYVTGLANVRDAIPFPRTPGNARY